MRRHRRADLVPFVGLALAVALAATPVAQATRPKKQYYLSLGDSYAVGFQLNGPTNHGFADQLVRLLAKRGYNVRLVNLGCAGATTASMVRQVNCPALIRAPAAPAYPDQTQITAAEKFLRTHKGNVALVTMSIGGNDAASCAAQPDAISCFSSTGKNVSALAKRLRRAGGPKVRIVGTTYPDVTLGTWITGDHDERNRARLSIAVFKTLINPALKNAYASAKGQFADVTAATGAYGSLDDLTTLAPYGLIPVPVANVCALTYSCDFRNPHMKTQGYAIIAQLIAKILPRRR